MKKNILSILEICAALFGCQKNELSETLSSGGDLHATIADETSTRTVMDDQNNIRWSEGDQIIAFAKTSLGQKYQLKESYVGETSGYFSKVSSGSSDDLGAGMEWDHIVAYYPYAESVRCARSGEDYILDVVLPAGQTYAPESFGNGFFPMAAISEDNDLTFKNVCGGLKLQLKGTAKVKTIELKGNAGELLSGKASVTVYSGGAVPSIAMASDASKSIILDCGAGVQLNEETATEFILTVPPVAFAAGFTVTVTDVQNGTAVLSTDKANPVKRSAILSMPAMTVKTEPAFTPTEYCFTATYTATAEYDRSIVIYNREIAGEGNPCLYIDYGDGTSGKSPEHTYDKEGDYIVKCYFENPVTEIADWAFSAGITLFMKSVIIPKTVKKIGGSAFMGQSINFDSRLEEVLFEDDRQLETIGNRAFAFNSSLKELWLPASVKEIDYAIVYCCRQLEHISSPFFSGTAGQYICDTDGQKSCLIATICKYPSSYGGSYSIGGYFDTTVKTGCFSFCDLTYIRWSYITAIESSCFEWCDNLEEVDLEKTVTIGSNVLHDCKNLRSIYLPLASSIGSGCLCRNESLETIELACEDLKEINTIANDCASLREIRIPSGVLSISSSFNNDPSIDAVYVSALTPPALTGSFDSMQQDAVIYVPCPSLAAYKSASGWSTYADMMVPYDFEKGEICSTPSYVDEYGISHGHGVKIGETVWAPVNCGYHATDYKYGKLYQWGRKYGQGYDGSFIVDGVSSGTYTDAVVPTKARGCVSLDVGQNPMNSNVFYTSRIEYAESWISPLDNKLWNSGTESEPIKTDYDPCPAGWRVPTYAELNALISHSSSWTTDDAGQEGYYFCGPYAYSSDCPCIFFPAAGYRSDGGYGNPRGYYGKYWSSKAIDDKGYENCAGCLDFHDERVVMSSNGQGMGYSVRCVQVPTKSLSFSEE